MNDRRMIRLARAVAMMLLPIIASMPSLSVVAQDRKESAHESDRNRDRFPDRKTKRIRGVAVTGVNSVLGKPFFSWGEPFGTFNFPTTFVYNEQGIEPLPVDENTPGSAVLSTGVSLDYLMVRGSSPDDIKPEWVNVPLRNVPVNTDFAFVKENALPGVREADPLELSQTEPSTSITLDDWMRASGVASIDCERDGADIELRMKNLIPNRIYSVWATMELPAPGSPEPALPLPVGGTPNIFVTDDRGDAVFKRWIQFCPLASRASDGPPMLIMEVIFHANHQTWGAVPAPGFLPGELLGVVQFSHVVFPINVELLKDKAAGAAGR